MQRCTRRGQYSLLFALVLVPLMLVAAVAIDTATASVHASQAESVAYAAAHTAIVAYSQGKTQTEAEALAKQVVVDHPSLFDGQDYQLDRLEWGRVDRTTGAFSAFAVVEAARARVSRPGVTTLFGGLAGPQSVTIEGVAVSDQIPSQLHNDVCTTQIDFALSGKDGLSGLGNLERVVTVQINDPPPSGWYRLYKAGVAESGSSQRNESAVFRLTNPANPRGLPLASEANCGDQYVVRDYDNGLKGHFKLKERVYLGTFYIDEDGPNALDMQHYCAFVDTCPQFHDESQPCGSKAHSVHLQQGWALCGEAL
ncbi:MAG: hypothetical protein AAF211_10005 [Myxococcota bacterium]